MDALDYYYFMYGIPVLLGVFFISSAIMASKDKDFLSLGILVGFALMLVGYCMQNFGPHDVTYAQNGNANIQYTWLFSVGHQISGLGLFFAAVFTLFKAIKHAPRKCA